MAPIANPQTAAYTLLTFGGSWTNGTDSEIWQCGLKLGSAGGAGFTPLKMDNLQGYLNAVKTPLSNWFAAAANGMRSDFKLLWAKAANIAGGSLGKGQPGGHYDGTHDFSGGVNPALVSYGAGTPGGVAPGTCVPVLLTVCFTYKSAANARARAGAHGRIYPPIRVGTNALRIGSGDVATCLVSAKALLAAVSANNVASGNGGTTSVAPGLFGRDGSSHAIDLVAIGDVIDVQRRRKNALREAYTVSTYP